MMLAYVNYVVFNEWVMFHCERWRTSYKFFAAVAFETTSLTALGVLGKEFLAFGQMRWARFFRWLGVFCMAISTFYVLAFPTLMGAMTGYITTFEPYLEDYRGDFLEWGRSEEVVGVVEGADRVGFGSEFVRFTAGDEELRQAVDACKSCLIQKEST